MCLVDFAKIFWPFVAIKELKHLLSRNNPVEMAKDKQDRHVAIEFLEDAQIINTKNFVVCFFLCSLFYQVKHWFQ